MQIQTYEDQRKPTEIFIKRVSFFSLCLLAVNLQLINFDQLFVRLRILTNFIIDEYLEYIILGVGLKKIKGLKGLVISIQCPI